jgi:hypothetical protein
MSKKRKAIVALSTIEAKHMATTHGNKDIVWLQRFCLCIDFSWKAMRVDCDSSSAIFLARNPAYHSNIKYNDVQYHFVRNMVEHNKVSLDNIDTLKNVANSLTKSVNTEKFYWCKESMGIVSLSSQLG